ncbi:DUF4271 domain-containing protein [Daejeonella oryzae]|uniref:DUF4271 domain-containing protein n=1 Tax=Daejeonella oryzae TaxID=1122943 RepID=UPI0004276E10|nr:DUF4271 domain-containing protein [Daejeonella oryzae]
MVQKIFCLGMIFFLFLQTSAIAQRDTASSDSIKQASVSTPESDNLIGKPYQKIDSLKNNADSLSMLWIKAPDPNRPNQFLDSLIDLYTVEKFNFQAWAKKFPKKYKVENEGKLRNTGKTWVILVIIALILFFAILKNAFSKELSSIIQSFYSNRALGQINKEDMLFNSWPFLFLYLLFGLSIGMFLYLSGEHYQIKYAFTGFEWFLILSATIIGAFTLKILVLRILGFLFGVQKIVSEYITILYLSYFNAALIFLPLLLAYSLTPSRFSEVYSYIAIIIIGLIFTFQFIRAGANILTNYRFSKTYLIIYLCALEVCPILILIKALRF